MCKSPVKTSKMEYSNLTVDALEIVEGAPPSPSNQVRLALKRISEGTKTNSKEISRNHLVTTIRSLSDEFGWLKKSVSEDESSDEFDDARDGAKKKIDKSQDSDGGKGKDPNKGQGKPFSCSKCDEIFSSSVFPKIILFLCC